MNIHIFSHSKAVNVVGIFSLFLITVFFFILAIQPTSPIGESDDYMLTTVAIQNHGTIRITQEDVQRAMRDFPEHAWYFEQSWQTGMPALFSVDGENIYPWYMGTYSATCIPMKILLEYLNLPQSYAFALTNALFASIAIWVCWFLLKAPVLKRLTLILLLGISPICWYIYWPSAETFIYSMMVMSLVSYSNKNYHLAGLFISIAGTLNIAAMAWGLFMILDYVKMTYCFYMQKGEKNVFRIIFQDRKSLGCLIICYLPSLITPVFNLVNFGLMNLQSSLGFASYEGYLGRVFMHLFDLNIGFLAYFLLLFPLYILQVFQGFFQKKSRWNTFVYFGGFILTVALYSVTFHINSGMTGLPRYSAWAFPLFVFYVVTSWNFTKILYQKALALFACFSVLSTWMVTFPRTTDIQLSNVASLVMNIIPQIYNPYPPTFLARVAQLPGGYLSLEEDVPDSLSTYDDRLPAVYTDPSGNVRKILATSKQAAGLFTYFEGDKDSMSQLQSQIESIDTNENLIYISLNKNLKIKKIYLNERFAYTYGDTLREGFIPITKFSITSGEKVSAEGAIIHSEEIMYGPYLKMEKGKYVIILSGENLDQIEPRVTANLTTNVPINIISQSVNEIKYSLDLKSDAKNVELLAINNGCSNSIVNAIFIENK